MFRQSISFCIVILALLAVLTLAACSNANPQVSFSEPKDGATVTSPVVVRLTAQNFTVEPAGEIKEGAGHLHILVDAGCTPAGDVIIKDDTHLHYGKGQMEAELELAPGKHTLCLQAADGAHIALAGDGMTDTIAIEVR